MENIWFVCQSLISFNIFLAPAVSRALCDGCQISHLETNQTFYDLQTLIGLLNVRSDNKYPVVI